MASRTTNYQEIQQDEMDALRSIYVEDFKEEAVKTGAWNVCGNVLITNIILNASVVVNHGEVYEYLSSQSAAVSVVVRQE